MADGKVIIETKLDTSGLETGAKQATSTVNNLGKSMKNASENSKALDNGIQGATKSLKTLETLAKSNVVMKIANLAMKTVTQIGEETEKVSAKLKGASTLYGNVAVDQQRLLENLYAISNQTGESVETLGQSIYDALSAGIEPTEDMANVLQVVGESAKLAKGGFTDTSTALSATISVLNAYKMDVSKLTDVQNMLLQTQNKGVTTVGELGSALAKVTPTASSFGVKFKDVATSIALMTKQGTKTEIATTALAQVISELGKSGTTASKNLAEAAENAGLAQTSFSDLLDTGMSLGEILNLMSDYATKNGKTMVDMFSSIEAGRATLQLVGNNAEAYTEILNSMEKSAGLVQESFEKTVEPTEQLASAFSNLFSGIGMSFKPLVDSLATGLASVVNKMAGQKKESSDLSSALKWLQTATENAESAQKNLGDTVEKTGDSFSYQSRLQYYTQLSTVSDRYKDAEQSLLSYKSALKDATNQQKIYYDILIKATNNHGYSYDYITESVAKYRAGVISLAKAFPEATSAERKGYVNAIENLDAIDSKVESLKSTVTEQQKAINGYVGALVDAVNTGVLSLSDIYAVNNSLGKAVTDAMNNASSASIDLNNNLADTSDNLDDVGDSGNDASKDIEGFAKDLADVTAKYTNLKNAGDLLGESLYSQEDELSDLVDLYTKYAEQGYASSSQMLTLKKRIDALNESVNKGKFSWKEFGKEVKNTSEELATSLSKNLGSAIESFVEDLLTIDEQVSEIDTKLQDAFSNQEDNASSLLTAEQQLQDAKARGNASAIAQAQEEVDRLKKQQEAIKTTITSLQDQKKSIQDGSKAWGDFGKTALLALADVLEALGAQLAAQAVSMAFSFRWVEAGLATAGSVAAYVAAAAIKANAQKFATGGIVQGSSRQGDNVLVRANAGELVLNTAQQDNLARLIEASASLAQATGEGSGAVNIRFEGSYFYGLDEPAVGKAIYDNIQTLKYEGVI